MDAETLAAVRWARDKLPAGSRIGADRLSSTLLASQAGLWPVFTHATEPMYRRCTRPTTGAHRSPTWPAACDYGTSMSIGPVRRRTTPASARISPDESPPLKLTPTQLTKFDSVPGIQEVYSEHGPISIYDLGLTWVTVGADSGFRSCGADGSEKPSLLTFRYRS